MRDIKDLDQICIIQFKDTYNDCKSKLNQDEVSTVVKLLHHCCVKEFNNELIAKVV